MSRQVFIALLMILLWVVPIEKAYAQVKEDVSDAGISDASNNEGMDAAIRKGVILNDGGIIDAGAVNSSTHFDGGKSDVVDAGVSRELIPSDARSSAVILIKDASEEDGLGTIAHDALLPVKSNIETKEEPSPGKTKVSDSKKEGDPQRTTKEPKSKRKTLSVGGFLKVVVGLSLLLLLAYAGSHSKVLKLEERLKVSQLVTAGFPFVLLGLFAQHSSIGILSESVLESIQPLLHFGLGWLGFIVGLQFDVRVLDRVPRGTGVRLVMEAGVPFVLVTVVCALVMLSFGQSISDPTFWRDAVVLGVAGAMTAPRTSRGLLSKGWKKADTTDALISQLDEIVGIVGLLFLAAYYRPAKAAIAWQLPETAWLFITFGIGATLGFLLYIMMRTKLTRGEFFAITLGFVAFGSGFAGMLELSPVVVCCVGGILLANFPGDQRKQLESTLALVERPIHLVFLTVVGAFWHFGDWRGWLLLPCFLAARIIGKWIGIKFGDQALRTQGIKVSNEHRDIVMPLSILAIAIVVSVQSLYHTDGAIPWIVTAVIGGAFITEILVQFTHEFAHFPFGGFGSFGGRDKGEDEQESSSVEEKEVKK